MTIILKVAMLNKPFKNITMNIPFLLLSKNFVDEEKLNNIASRLP
jgi:hypothetical protein